jgi:hypothetical protein
LKNKTTTATVRVPTAIARTLASATRSDWVAVVEEEDADADADAEEDPEGDPEEDSVVTDSVTDSVTNSVTDSVIEQSVLTLFTNVNVFKCLLT